MEHIALIVTLLSRCCNEDFIDVFPSGFSEVLHPSRVTSGVFEGSVEDARDPNQYLLCRPLYALVEDDCLYRGKLK